VPVFAVDIPSGLNADTGLPSGVAIQAEGTATFGFAKIGHVVFPGAAYTGRLAIVDIGIAEEAIGQQPAQTELLEAADAASLLPVRRPDTHKGDCGHLLIIAGSFGKTGAARLASRAALRAGAGLVTLVGPASLYTIYATAVVEVMTDVLPDRDGRISFDERKLTALLEGKSALVVGPGIGTHEDAFATVTWLLSRSNLPIVLDADALTCISRDLTALRNARARAVLTPHPGEMARLTGRSSADVQRDRVRAAREFAAQNRCTLVLKGARTVIADPSSHAWINPTGNPGMASGGMGDVLSGMIGAFVAQGLSPSAAACLGVYTHGLVADQVAERHGEIGLIAGDLIDGLPRALASLRRELDV
jgi:NAD(P)H-hydrate epimerase